MLIEFSVTNFLSFSEKQTLSLVADNSKELEMTNTFLPVGKAKLPRLLPSVGIYGANAAGKSNLLHAMKVMRKTVLLSAKESQMDEPIEGLIPHALFADKPTEFEVIFIVEGIRYQYGFAATHEFITEEWLLAFPSGRPQRWLSRIYDAESKEYSWFINTNQVKGKRDLWKKSTRNNALFLSTAAQLNSEQLTPIFQWFEENLDSDIPHENTIDFLTNHKYKQRIIDFFRSVDIGIKDIEITEEQSGIKGVKMTHQDALGKRFKLPLELESWGTRELFFTAQKYLNILINGYVFCVDGLGMGLHPLITRFLISLFNNPDINTFRF